MNVLYYIPDYGGVGHLRAIFPNDVLNSVFANSRVYNGIVSDKFLGDGRFINSMDVVRFQRQITGSQIGYIQQLKQLKDAGHIKPGFIFDMDDYLNDIPTYNYSKSYFQSFDMNATMNILFECMDIFTSSTKYLSYKLQKLKGNKITKCSFQILPNLLPKFLYYSEIEKKENNKPKVVWAGSTAHYSLTSDDMGDLGLIYDLIVNTKNEWDWYFMGGCPNPIKRLEGIKILDWANCFSYPRILRSINADFGFAPLLDNEFNKCKSNIKYLEYSASQIITIASDLEPYKDDVKFFLKPTWQETRDMITELFLNKQKKQEILNEQNENMKRYWLEDNLIQYTNMLGLKLPSRQI